MTQLEKNMMKMVEVSTMFAVLSHQLPPSTPITLDGNKLGINVNNDGSISFVEGGNN